MHLVAFALSLAGLLLATWPERVNAGASARSG
jgi:hypothetical protein